MYELFKLNNKWTCNLGNLAKLDEHSLIYAIKWRLFIPTCNVQEFAKNISAWDFLFFYIARPGQGQCCHSISAALNCIIYFRSIVDFRPSERQT